MKRAHRWFRRVLKGTVSSITYCRCCGLVQGCVGTDKSCPYAQED